MSERARPQAAAAEKAAAVQRVPSWFHSIDLGDGVVTPGHKSLDLLASEARAIGLPARLDGMSVLDIGAWDGGYSFEAERRGASRVLSLDHYVWALDLPAHHAYVARCQATGQTPLRYDETPYWHPDTTPGKLGYDTAHRYLGSRVQSRFEDFMDATAAEIGTWDIVLFLGILYHVEDPLASVRKLAELTERLAIVETQALVVPGYEHHPLWELFPGSELANDPSNWWVPNLSGLAAILKAAGFGEVIVQTGPPAIAPGTHAPGEPVHFRAAVHAFK